MKSFRNIGESLNFHVSIKFLFSPNLGFTFHTQHMDLLFSEIFKNPDH